MIRVGRINYLNVAPYFHFWPSDAFELVAMPPRQLAAAAVRGEVDAGPLPIVEGWKMDGEFETLRRWGISSREKCGSVLVLSSKPFAELRNATIGVTEDTSTSVLLATLLLNHRLGLNATFRRGFLPTDDAWLVIGDQALRYGWNIDRSPFSVVTDLATEWWNWQKLPFVFARWVARRSMSVGDRARLEWLLGESLDRGLSDLTQVSIAAAEGTAFAAPAVHGYLNDFVYELGEDAEESATLFRRLLDEAGLLKAAVMR